MDLSDVRIGDELWVPLTPTDENGLPETPTANPVLTLYLDGALAYTTSMTKVKQHHGDSGAQWEAIIPTRDLSAGRYLVRMTWTVSVERVALAYVTVVAGSDKGTVLAMVSYECPHAQFIVWQGTDGELHRGRNPS